MKILFLCYWYPPSNIVGATRSYSISKYLASDSFEVSVLTARSTVVRQDYIVPLDDINIHYVNDHFLTSMLSYRDSDSRLPHLIRSFFRRFVLFDSQIFTALFAIIYILNFLKTNKYDFIYASAPPFSFFITAIFAKYFFSASLILDIRDVWASNPYRIRFPTPLSSLVDNYLQSLIFSKADLLTTISPGMTSALQKKHPQYLSKFFTHCNGVDDSNLNPIPYSFDSTSTFSLVYTGSLYSGSRLVHPLFTALAAFPYSFTIDFYGSEKSVVDLYASQHPSLRIRFFREVSRSQCINAQAKASVLLLLMGIDHINSYSLPGKFFEYVAANRPILALAPANYDISKIINQYSLGLASLSELVILSFLERVRSGDFRMPISVDYRLTRTFQIRSFISRLSALYH